MPNLLAKAICVLWKWYRLDWCYFWIIELKRSVVGLVDLHYQIPYRFQVKTAMNTCCFVCFLFHENKPEKTVAFASEMQSKSRSFCVLGLEYWTRWIYCGFRFGVCASVGTIIFLAYFHQMNIHDVLSLLIWI